MAMNIGWNYLKVPFHSMAPRVSLLQQQQTRRDDWLPAVRWKVRKYAARAMKQVDEATLTPEGEILSPGESYWIEVMIHRLVELNRHIREEQLQMQR